jgi:hypothetical protein
MRLGTRNEGVLADAEGTSVQRWEVLGEKVTTGRWDPYSGKSGDILKELRMEKSRSPSVSE